MDEPSAIDELRLATRHLLNAAERVLTGVREGTGILLERTGLAQPLRRVRDGRALQTFGRRLSDWRSNAVGSSQPVRIVLSERLAGRLPVSHDEFEGLRRRVERLEEQAGLRAA